MNMNMYPKGKPRILLYFSHSRATMGLNRENLKEFLETCEVDVILGRDDNKLEFGNPIQNTVSNAPLPAWKENTWYIAYYNVFLKFLDNFDHEWLRAAHLYKGMSHKVRRLIIILRKLHLLNLVSQVCEKRLRRNNPYSKLLSPRYDAVVAYNGLKDPWYDDIAHWARTNGIPIMGIPINWDNLSSKPFLVKPDFLGVWGLQNLYFARAYQNFPFHKTFQIGSARFEDHYRMPVLTKQEWRKKLGLEPSGKLVLFAGAGENFDEKSLLEILDRALQNRHFSDDLTILYKPHPQRFGGVRRSIPESWNLKTIKIWPGLMEPLGVSENSALLAASDGIISAYSTLVLEGAYFGLPSVGIFYNDPLHSDHDWEVYGRHVNLLPMFVAKWNIEVRSKEAFLPAVQNLVKLMGRSEIEAAARADFDHCVYRDEVTYGRRLVIALEKILKRSMLKEGPRPHTIHIG